MIQHASGGATHAVALQCLSGHQVFRTPEARAIWVGLVPTCTFTLLNLSDSRGTAELGGWTQYVLPIWLRPDSVSCLAPTRHASAAKCRAQAQMPPVHRWR